MQKLTKEDISQEVFDLYDDYAHNKIGRRQFIEKLSVFCCWSYYPSFSFKLYNTQLCR